MDKNQAETIADVMIEGERSKQPIKKPQGVVPTRRQVKGLGAIIGFGLGMLVGGFFFDNTFPASLIGLVLGTLASRYFGNYLVRPKA